MRPFINLVTVFSVNFDPDDTPMTHSFNMSPPPSPPVDTSSFPHVSLVR